MIHLPKPHLFPGWLVWSSSCWLPFWYHQSTLVCHLKVGDLRRYQGVSTTPTSWCMLGQSTSSTQLAAMAHRDWTHRSRWDHWGVQCTPHKLHFFKELAKDTPWFAYEAEVRVFLPAHSLINVSNLSLLRYMQYRVILWNSGYKKGPFHKSRHYCCVEERNTETPDFHNKMFKHLQVIKDDRGEIRYSWQ